MIAITTTRNNSGTVHYVTTGADGFAAVEALAGDTFTALGEDGWIVGQSGTEGVARVVGRRYLNGMVSDEIIVDYLLMP